MKKQVASILALLVFLTSCGPAPRIVQPTLTLVPTIAIPSETPSPLTTATATLTPTVTPVPNTATPSLTPTPAYPAAGRGPTGFNENEDPLTGLVVKNPALLARRPIVIKVENIPRAHRPQWGLSLADLVYEYYTEQGATRFAAIFYGNDAERVGPIRSGRFFDSNIVQMYKAIFVYGSAYPPVQSRFFNSDFANRLILETNQSCPGLCRYDPNGQNLLVANTAALQDYLPKRGVDNTRQNLDGMFFQKQSPAASGDQATQVYVRYSGAIYNRWDYDPNTDRYLRFSDKQDDVNRTNEVYEQLTDRLTSQPIAADNVVTLCVPHQYYARTPEVEVLDIIMDSSAASYVGCDGQTYKGGTGAAYIARDGKMYKVIWQRAQRNTALTLLNADGTLFPFKPGQTWFEVIGASSNVASKGAGVWRFTHMMVP